MLLTLAKYQLMQGKARAALRLLAQFRRQEPDAETPDVLTLSARAYQQAGDTHAAALLRVQSSKTQQRFLRLTAAEDRAGLAPRDPTARMELARQCAAAGQNAKALYEYEACLSLQPDNRIARKESQALTARLIRLGKMPDRDLYRKMASLTAR